MALVALAAAWLLRRRSHTPGRGIAAQPLVPPPRAHELPLPPAGDLVPPPIVPEEPFLCVATTEPRTAAAASRPIDWPCVVHVLHDEGLASEIAEQLATSPTLPHGLALVRTSCASFKQIAWGGSARHVAVLIVSTLENEQPTEEAGQMVRFFMRRAHPAGMLTGKLAYAVLGLGDSNLLLDRQTTSAKDCNQVAQRLDKRLAELGGMPICARGEADDRTGNCEVEPWLRALERALEATCGAGERAAGEGCTAECCADIARRPRIRVPARRE